MEKFTFTCDATQYVPENAYWLGQCAQLVYSDDVDATQKELQGWGFNNFKFISKMDTQCFVTGNEDMVIVAFRGTEPDKVMDIVADLNAIQTEGPWGKVHAGFSKALEFCWDELIAAIKLFSAGNQKIWITGHSLGGALATLATARLIKEKQLTIEGTYTFGQPRVGDSEFSHNYDTAMRNRHIRFVNNNDIVPHCPPEELKVKSLDLKYSHVEKMGYFKTDGTLTFKIGSFALKIDKAAGFLEGGWKDEINDHFMTNYIDSLKKNLIC